MILLVLGALDIIAAFVGLLGHFGIASFSLLVAASAILFVKFLLFSRSLLSKVDLIICLYFLGIAFFGLNTPLIFLFVFFLFQKGIVSVFS